MNKVYLMGTVGTDVELRYAPSGIAVGTFSMATHSYRKGHDEVTYWHNIKAFSKTAEICTESMRKGDTVFVEGEIQTRSYKDKATGQNRYFTEVVANTVRKIAKKELPSQPDLGLVDQVNPSDINTRMAEADFTEDDIPF